MQSSFRYWLLIVDAIYLRLSESIWKPRLGKRRARPREPARGEIGSRVKTQKREASRHSTSTAEIGCSYGSSTDSSRQVQGGANFRKSQ